VADFIENRIWGFLDRIGKVFKSGLEFHRFFGLKFRKKFARDRIFEIVWRKLRRKKLAPLAGVSHVLDDAIAEAKILIFRKFSIKNVEFRSPQSDTTKNVVATVAKHRIFDVPAGGPVAKSNFESIGANDLVEQLADRKIRVKTVSNFECHCAKFAIFAGQAVGAIFAVFAVPEAGSGAVFGGEIPVRPEDIFLAKSIKISPHPIQN